MVYRSDYRYLPYSIQFLRVYVHFFFSRENRENTKILGVRHETKMDADGYWARKALLVRELWVAVKVPTFYSGNWRFRDALLGNLTKTAEDDYGNVGKRQ